MPIIFNGKNQKVKATQQIIDSMSKNVTQKNFQTLTTNLVNDINIVRFEDYENQGFSGMPKMAFEIFSEITTIEDENGDQLMVVDEDGESVNSDTISKEENKKILNKNYYVLSNQELKDSIDAGIYDNSKEFNKHLSLRMKGLEFVKDDEITINTNEVSINNLQRVDYNLSENNYNEIKTLKSQNNKIFFNQNDINNTFHELFLNTLQDMKQFEDVKSMPINDLYKKDKLELNINNELEVKRKNNLLETDIDVFKDDQKDQNNSDYENIKNNITIEDELNLNESIESEKQPEVEDELEM